MSDGERPADSGSGSADPAQWITRGSIPSAVWRLALPITATMLCQNVFSIVDMIFVGRLGKAAVAGVGVAGVVIGIVHMLAVGITTGCTAMVARAIGAGDRAGAERAAAQGLVMGLGLSALVAGSGVLLAGFVMRLLGAEPEVVEAGSSYLRVMTGGSAVMILAFVFGSALRGAGDARTPLIAVAAANAVNIALDPLLIFGLCGLPRLEVAGSAWATIISRFGATAALGWLFFVRGHRQFHLRAADMVPDLTTISRILRIGVFGSGQMLIRNISALVVMRIVTPFGTVAVAAYTIGLKLWFMVLMVGIGMGTAAGTLVGQNLGAARPGRAERAGWITAGVYAAFSAVLSVAFFIWAARLVSAFNADPGVVATGASFLHWIAPPFVFMALAVVLGGAMNGAGDTLVPLVIVAFAVLVVRIPLALWLARDLESVEGVWAALALSTALQGLLYSAAFRWGHWKRVQVGGKPRGEA
jgi:putative MATE family efflux protein